MVWMRELTDVQRMMVSLALDAARNCLPLFEAEYADDSRPRSALEALERWLAEPTAENYLALQKLEKGILRCKDWTSESASFAAQACASALRAARHPVSSAMSAIECERCAHGIETQDDYSRRWLWRVLHRIEPVYTRL
jgi:Imm-5 like putative immunity protein